jgi:hypothetical protein
MDQFKRTTKLRGEAVINGKDYSVGFGLSGQVCTLHRHIKSPDEKWTSIPASSPRFDSLRKRVEGLAEKTV